MFDLLTIVATGLIAIYACLHLYLYFTHDAKEPPRIIPLIPFLTPVLGVLRKKNHYYSELRDKHNLPICTLRMPGERMYILNSTSLIPPIQRQYMTLAWPPVAAKFTSLACGLSRHAHDATMRFNKHERYGGYTQMFLKLIHTELAPGAGLDSMNRVMAQRVSASFDELKQPTKVGLSGFVRHKITLASTDSVYGEHNPFRDPAVEDSFWVFLPGIMTFISGILPSIFAKKSYEAREFTARAFEHYFNQHHHLQGSSMVQARYTHSLKNAISIPDIARLEVGGAIGVLTNTVPVAFWTIYHIFSSPSILSSCRSELSKIISTTTETTTPSSGNNKKTTTRKTIDMLSLKTTCPILQSTLQEVLRVHTIGVSARRVMDPTILDNKFLLKKDSMLIIPSPVQHSDASAWGDTAHVFDHTRFLRSKDKKRHNPVAFRGFGGGTTLCPGRHFASNEILAFAAMMVLRFDVEPTKGGWVMPRTERVGLWETTAMPDEDVEVLIRPREGEEGERDVEWKVVVTDSDQVVKLAVEDM